MKIILLVTFFLGALLGGRVYSAGEIPSNFDLLKSLSVQVLQEKLSSSLFDSIRQVELFSINPKDSNNWFIESILFDYFNNLKIKDISLNPGSRRILPDKLPAKPALRIKYRINQLGIQYISSDKFWSFRSKGLTRKASVQYYLQVVHNQNQQIIWDGIILNFYEDQLPVREVKNVELEGVVFTKANVPVRNIYTRFVEPVIMLGTAGVIIYLFYSFRGQ